MPNAFLNMDETWFCDYHCFDIEPDDPTCCDKRKDYKNCKECPHAQKQSYNIVIQRED